MALDKTYLHQYRQFTIDTVPASVTVTSESEFMDIIHKFLAKNDTFTTSTRPIKHPMSLLMTDLVDSGDVCGITLIENIEKTLPEVVITGMTFTKPHVNSDIIVTFTV